MISSFRYLRKKCYQYNYAVWIFQDVLHLSFQMFCTYSILCSISTSLVTFAQGSFGCFTVFLLFQCNPNSDIVQWLGKLYKTPTINYIKLIYTQFNNFLNRIQSLRQSQYFKISGLEPFTGFVYVHVSSLSKQSEFVYELVMLRVPDRAEREKEMLIKVHFSLQTNITWATQGRLLL